MRQYRQLFIMLLSTVLVACSSHHQQQYLGYIEGRYINLSSKVSGHLEQLPIRKGQQVKANQLAYTLDPEPELSELAAAKADLKTQEFQLANLEKGQRETILKRLAALVRQAKSNVTFTNKMYARDQELIKTKAIGQAQLDRSRNDYQMSLQRLQAAKADLAEAKQGARSDEILAQKARVQSARAKVTNLTWIVKQKRMKIPKSGVIQNTFYRVGEFVPAGRPVASLLTPDNRYVVFYIPEKKLSQLAIGQKIFFTCDGCEQSVPATVSFISTQAEYTPPVIYSKDSREKLVYYVEADMAKDIATRFHPGQPIQVRLSK